MCPNLSGENEETLAEHFYKGFLVPRAGVEPARVAPLVFETSASTDSAIWAWSKTAAKVQQFDET